MKRSQCSRSALTLLILAAVAAAAAQERERGERRARVEASTVRAGEPIPPQDEMARVEAARPEPIREAKLSVVPLRHAEAGAVAAMLTQVAPIFGERIVAIPDRRSNQLLLAAGGDERLAQLRALIEALDQPASPDAPAGEEAAAVPLKHGAATEVARVVEHLLREDPRNPELRFVADERSNTIWVFGRKSLVEGAVRLIQRVDERNAGAGEQKPTGVRELYFHELKHADAEHLAKGLQAILRAMDWDVGVVADPAANLIITYATAAQETEVAKIVTRLDVPGRRVVPPAAPPEPPTRRAPARDRGEGQ